MIQTSAEVTRQKGGSCESGHLYRGQIHEHFFNAVDVGITDQGIELQQESRWETIETSDAYGDSIIDGVYRGGNAYLMYVSKAYKAGSIVPFWPWQLLGKMAGATNPIGRLASNVGLPTVLSAVANTPAQVGDAPSTLTSALSILAPNNPAALLFHSRLRQVPLRLLMLPNTQNGTDTVWFTTT